jgi:predicted amidohydrolase
MEKDNSGEFVVDAISSDGGAIPRNFILSYGILLIKFGGLTFKEFVKKVSWTPAKMLGLENKGHFTPGADADVIVVDQENGQVEEVLSNGQVCMASGIVFDLPGKILTTERGVKYLQNFQVPYEIIDLGKSIYFKGKEVKS